MRYGIVNMMVLDTTPGAEGAFSPPLGFNPHEMSYRKFMIEMLTHDCGVRQHVAAVARRLVRLDPPRFIGPFAGDARKLARDVLKSLAQKAASEKEA